LVNERPPNGFKINIGSAVTGLVNGKTIPSSLRRNGLPKSIDPLPLKKRHLRRYQKMASESEEPANLTTQTISGEPLCEEPLIVRSPVALEQQVQIVLADSVNDLQPHNEELITSSDQISLREQTLLKVNSSVASSFIETKNSTVTSQTYALTVTTSDTGIHQRRPSDPRLVNNSPGASTNTALSPGYGVPVVTSSVSPVAVVTPIAGQSVMQFSQNNDSSGTPGKKKVSLLEYRNRSRNRLSVDLPPRTFPQHTAVVTPPSNSSSASGFPSSVIKSSSLSASLPNLSASSATPSLVHRPVASSGELNGPHLEPVSPDSEDKPSGLLRRLPKTRSSAYDRGSSSSREGKGFMYGDGDSRLKREIQKKHEELTKKEESLAKVNEKLSSFFTVHLQKDSVSKHSSVVGRSPSNSTSSNESSNPPAEITGDAMEIEDEDSNSNANIYISPPMAVASSHAHSTHIPHRPSLLSQFPQNYRISHSHPPHYIATAAPQLPSPSQPASRIPNSSPQYLVTSPSAPAHVRFQSPYQATPSQTAGFYHH